MCFRFDESVIFFLRILNKNTSSILTLYNIISSDYYFKPCLETVKAFFPTHFTMEYPFDPQELTIFALLG